MNIHDFLSPPVETARRAGPHDRIVMSSRVRLARNLKGIAFPGWAKKNERVKALDIIRPAVESLPQLNGAFSETMDNLGPLDKQILVERHLISRRTSSASTPWITSPIGQYRCWSFTVPRTIACRSIRA